MPGEHGKNGEDFSPDPEKDNQAEHDTAFLQRVEDLYARLDSLDFYTVLGTNARATKEEIKKAYYRVARDFHPDRHSATSSDALKHKLNSIFSYLTQAYRVLSHEEEKREYDMESSASVHERKDGASLAKKKFQEGHDAYSEGLYTEATEFFNQAIYLDRTVPDYYFFLGLSFKKSGKMNDAAKMLQHASSLDPSNPDYLAELGHVFLHLGFKLRAKTVFEKSIGIDPAHPRAKEGMVLARKQE